MEKVKITQKQAESIEAVKYIGHDEVVRQHSKENTGSLWAGEYSALNDLSLNTLIKALYIGYEVEETPEDKVKGIYEIATVIERNAIASTLKALNIKIEGIN